MSKIVFKILLLFLVITSCKRDKSSDYLNIPFIEYDVLLNNYGSNFFWFDNMDGFLRQDIFQHVINKAKSGDFRLETPDGKLIDAKEINNLFSIKIKRGQTDTIITLNSKNINGLRFREEWKVHIPTGKIKKSVIALCPLYFHQHKYNSVDRQWVVFPLFWIYPKDNKQVEEFHIPYIAYDVFIDNTVDDIRNSYHQPIEFYFSNLEQPRRKKLVSTLFDVSLRDQKNPVYDFFLTPLHEEQYQIYQKDYLREKTDTNQKIIDLNRIVKLKFIEQWIFYPNTCRINKEVLAVAPMAISYNEEGELRGYSYYFWIVFNKDKLKNIPFEE